MSLLDAYAHSSLFGWWLFGAALGGVAARLGASWEVIAAAAIIGSVALYAGLTDWLWQSTVRRLIRSSTPEERTLAIDRLRLERQLRHLEE